MMDMSAVIDAGLVFGGVVSVYIWAWSTLFLGSTTAFTAPNAESESGVVESYRLLKKAA
ncbi:MAG TPA: hypothetical protein VHF07_03505 [Nitrospiraceae bacterium]|nr:hypothetical protein [Nitrospiraceae bacterium]